MMKCHSNIARWLLSKVIMLKLSPSILTEPKLFCQEKREKPLKGRYAKLVGSLRRGFRGCYFSETYF